MSEKPLYVQVAEALGWAECDPFEADGLVDPENWVGEDTTQPNPRMIGGFEHGFIPRFDTDWSATGPLIEKHKINVFQYSDGKWEATAPALRLGFSAEAPLIAVCNLILKLKEAGKL